MKSIYSVATNFGGSGIGTTAYFAARGIFLHGNLNKVYCSSFSERDIPKGFIYSTRSSFFESMPFVPSAYQWFIKDNYHDLRVSLKAESCDIFHGWNGHSLFSMRAFKKKGAKSVIERASSHPVTFRTILENEYKKHGLKFTQMLVLNLAKLTRELKEADFITTPSDFSYQSMVENGIDYAKIVKLPYGVDTGRFRPAEKNPDGVFRVLFAGQVGIRKGVTYLLKAWERLALKNSMLIIAGQIDRDSAHIIKQFFSYSNIKFAGYTDLLPLYQSCDLFVFPSLEEGSALVTYEALSCGLPVITTFNSGSVVTDGEDGYIVPAQDIEKLAEKIKYLYENEDTKIEMGRKARLKAQNYTWDVYGDSLNKFYESIK